MRINLCFLRLKHTNEDDRNEDNQNVRKSKGWWCATPTQHQDRRDTPCHASQKQTCLIYQRQNFWWFSIEILRNRGYCRLVVWLECVSTFLSHTGASRPGVSKRPHLKAPMYDFRACIGRHACMRAPVLPIWHESTHA
jgi:hypothetical protein